MVDEVVLIRYRGLVSIFHSASGAAAGAERRANEAHQHLHQLKQERARQSNIRFAKTTHQAEHLEEIRRLAEAIAAAEVEVTRLAAEHARLAEVAAAANSNRCRARDYLMERHGMARSALEF